MELIMELRSFGGIAEAEEKDFSAHVRGFGI